MVELSFIILTAFSIHVLPWLPIGPKPVDLTIEFAKELARPDSVLRVVENSHQKQIVTNHKKIIGADQLQQQGITGRGITVAVVEGSFDPTHKDYAENLVKTTLSFGNILSACTLKPYLIYFLGFHGTHVIGTIGGKNGIATRARLSVAELEFIREGNEPLNKRDIEKISESLANVVNFSIVLVSPKVHQVQPISKEVKEAMIKLAQSGKIIVMGAGNDAITLGDNVYTKSLVELANSKEMKGRLIIVGATRYCFCHSKEQLARYSNKPGKAKHCFMVAPGDNIDGPDSFNRRIVLSGTSMATPMVSGALALLMEAVPGLKPEEYVDLLFRSARKKIIVDGKNTYSKEIFGHGVLDVKVALDLAIKEGKVSKRKKAV